MMELIRKNPGFGSQGNVTGAVVSGRTGTSVLNVQTTPYIPNNMMFGDLTDTLITGNQPHPDQTQTPTNLTVSVTYA